MPVVDIDLVALFDVINVYPSHLHCCIVHIQLVKGAVPDNYGSSGTYGIDARFAHRPMPQLMEPPNEQRFRLICVAVIFAGMQRLHAFIKSIFCCSGLHCAPWEFPAHGGNEFHGQ